jgi:hypothetical protein
VQSKYSGTEVWNPPYNRNVSYIRIVGSRAGCMDETTSGTKNRQQLIFQKTENLPVLGRSATGYSSE